MRMGVMLRIIWFIREVPHQNVWVAWASTLARVCVDGSRVSEYAYPCHPCVRHSRTYPETQLFRRRLVDRRCCASGCVYFDGPDVFLAASVAYEINPITRTPEWRQVSAAFGQAGAAGAVGVDDPQFLLGQGLLIIACRLHYRAESDLHAVGAPGGADDGCVGAG